MSGTNKIVALAGACALSFGCHALTDHDVTNHDHGAHHEGHESAHAAHGTDFAEMSMEDMMAMMAELATPGEEHEWLGRMIGTWNGEVKMWFEPGSEPEVSTGTLTNSWILGGRFVKQEWTGSSMGQPFEGFGLSGYNKSAERYEGFWIDTFGTMMSPVSHGQYDEATGELVMHRTMTDPNFGHMEMREVITMPDDDHMTFEMFMVGPEGEYKNLHIEYTRR